MELPEAQLGALSELCDKKVTVHEEAGFTYVYLSKLKLPDGCDPAQCDALLCPMSREGYNSRLFFESPIKPVKKLNTQDLNWNTKGIRILEKNWDAYSWKTPEGLTLVQMIALHLKALR
jgi:hypothetical protein